LQETQLPTNSASMQSPVTNISTLGSLWIAYAILRLLAAILLVLYSGTATVMFGALLTRVPDPLTLMTIFHVCYVGTIIVTILAGLFGLFAGLALLAAKSSARSLSIVASVLSVSDLPLGTTLGIYTLVAFLR
jgi:uncharacterized membrane protein